MWAGLAGTLAVPMAAAAASPLLAYRGPVYIVAGFAGVLALALLLVQPLLIGGLLTGLSAHRARKVHRVVGATLVVAVLVHVGGLWITSPPDVVDALLFASPTPFSNWGVIAMWAVFGLALLAGFRRKMQLSLRNWRIAHALLAVVIVPATIVHALLIEGTMETASKVVLCVVVLAATIKVILDLAFRISRSMPRKA